MEEAARVTRSFVEIPSVIAYIPDGNRRGALQKGATADEPHRDGMHNCRTLSEEAFRCGVKHVVIWGASESNLKERSKNEVWHLFELLKQELQRRMRRIQNDKVAFRICGLWQQSAPWPGLKELVAALEQKTAHYQDERCFTLLFGYDGETDNEQAVQRLFDAGIRPTKELIRQNLWTAHVPNTDLIIRTAVEGDPHDSDPFLPWQRKNAQHILSPKFWPAFDIADLHAAFDEYGRRPKRKGK
jgi:undecaprenyl diphosphate synthase